MNLTKKDFTTRFFSIAKQRGYSIESCRKGPYAGEMQVDFGNKKLHAGHLNKLYSLVRRKGTDISREEFESAVRGRPCAYLPFIEIVRIIIKEQNSESDNAD